MTILSQVLDETCAGISAPFVEAGLTPEQRKIPKHWRNYNPTPEEVVKSRELADKIVEIILATDGRITLR